MTSSRLDLRLWSNPRLIWRMVGQHSCRWECLAPWFCTLLPRFRRSRPQSRTHQSEWKKRWIGYGLTISYIWVSFDGDIVQRKHLLSPWVGRCFSRFPHYGLHTLVLMAMGGSRSFIWFAAWDTQRRHLFSAWHVNPWKGHLTKLSI